jgi:hypothetical protein
MLREGPVPVLVHGVVEYVAGALLVAAPFLFSYDSGAATAASIVLGLALLALTASSALPTGLVKTIPVSLHVGADVAMAALLVVSPFALGFRDEAAPTAVFLVLGVAHLLLTIATRFPGDRRAVRREPAR